MLPENIASRPIAILGAGTLGRRIALMLATRGAEGVLLDYKSVTITRFQPQERKY